MKKETKRRIAAYSIAALVLGGLAYGGFVYEAEPSPYQLFQSARILLVAGAVDKAVIDAERGLRQVPDDAYGHTVLADCYAMAGRSDDSLEHRRRALELTGPDDENFELLRLGYADGLLAVGRYEDAESEAAALCESHPQNHGAWTVVARAREERGRVEAARAAFRTACGTKTVAPTTFIALAGFEERAGDRSAGLAFLLEALGRWPGHPGLSVVAARMLYLEGRADQAVRLLAAVPREGRAQARMFLSRYEDAEELSSLEEMKRFLAPRAGGAAPGDFSEKELKGPDGIGR